MRYRAALIIIIPLGLCQYPVCLPTEHNIRETRKEQLAKDVFEIAKRSSITAPITIISASKKQVSIFISPIPVKIQSKDNVISTIFFDLLKLCGEYNKDKVRRQKSRITVGNISTQVSKVTNKQSVQALIAANFAIL